MKLDILGMPLEIHDPVVFLDIVTVTLRKGTVTSLVGDEHISVVADGLGTKFRVLPRDVINVNGLSLPNS